VQLSRSFSPKLAFFHNPVGSPEYWHLRYPANITKLWDAMATQIRQRVRSWNFQHIKIFSGFHRTRQCVDVPSEAKESFLPIRGRRGDGGVVSSIRKGLSRLFSEWVTRGTKPRLDLCTDLQRHFCEHWTTKYNANRDIRGRCWLNNHKLIRFLCAMTLGRCLFGFNAPEDAYMREECTLPKAIHWFQIDAV